MKKRLIEHHGSLDSDDSDFDIAYWSSVSTEEKFEAAWELIKYYYTSKGRAHELRLHRDITTIGTIESPVRPHRLIRRNELK